MTRKFLVKIVLWGMLPLLAFSCARQASRTQVKGVLITASFYPIYIMVKNVAADVPGVTVANMTSPNTGCLHDYQFTPADLEKIYATSIFVINGAGMEAFMDKVIRQVPMLKVVDSGVGIPLLRDPRTGIPNPHIFVSIDNAIAQVRNIAVGLSFYDPKHAAQYMRNTESYIRKLMNLRSIMLTTIKPMRGLRIITFHEAFPYFASEFGFKIVAVMEREPGTEPSARELAATIDIIRKHPGTLLFAEPQYPSKVADVIARETGVKVRFLDPAVTGPDSREAYLDIMEKNLQTLIDAGKGR